jgi:hypothetical protein
MVTDHTRRGYRYKPGAQVELERMERETRLELATSSLEG